MWILQDLAAMFSSSIEVLLSGLTAHQEKVTDVLITLFAEQ